MQFDPTQALANIRAAETDDLLDRVTAYRPGTEPEAVEMALRELRERGIGDDAILARQAETADCLRDADGAALPCSLCRRPAVARGRRWLTAFGFIPLVPTAARYCKEHQPKPAGATSS